MTDDLFRPTIAAGPDTRAARPWHPQSIVYPAFFGGPLAALVLGLLNVRRLAAARTAALAIAAAGVVAVTARFGVTMAAGDRPANPLWRGLAGVAVWGVVLLVQKRPFRVYLLGNDTEPASLVWPGLAAAVGCGILEIGLVLLVWELT